MSFLLLLAAALLLKPVDESGYQQLLKANAGKVVLVDIWAAWCEPCRAMMPETAKMAKRLAPEGFKYITVTIDNPEELNYAQKFLRKTGAPFPGYYRKAKDDEAWVKAVDARWTGSLPALFLYDRQGKKVKSYIGAVPASQLEADIRALLHP
jgi:thiol-disulfide isomerase/thioredoxin